jgi:hypothetical protein
MADTGDTTLTIDLRARTATFRGDMEQAQKIVQGSAREMLRMGHEADRGFDMHEAKGSLALIGEEFGVKIPRHIRGFIAELPGVGKALSSAFAGFAVIALIEVISKAREKITEYWEELGKLSKEDKKIYDEEIKQAKERLQLDIEGIKAKYELQIAEAKGLEKDRLRTDEAIALVRVNKDYIGTLEVQKAKLETLRQTAEGAAGSAREFASNINKLPTMSPGGRFRPYHSGHSGDS